MNRTRAALAAGAVALMAVAAGLVWWWQHRPPLPDRLVLQAASFAELPGWEADHLADAVPALLRSCAPLKREPPERDLGLAGLAGDWRPICAAAAALAPGDDAAARHFFEQYFQPVAARNQARPNGLFTGYFEVSLNGSRTPGGRYTVPLYRRPPDLVMVDLGLFRDDLHGARIAGRVVDGQLKPYETRAEIDQGALSGKGLELFWVDDPIDAFFVDIQGSGRVRLEDGSTVEIGYVAQNGYPYVPIGRKLVERGALDAKAVSMQSIRQWLLAHPAEARRVMEENPSYVFFREIKGGQAIGAEGVALTPGRSLAVDHRYIPYGVPLWLDTTLPGAAGAPLRRLMLAQDTGGAIRGPVRGDVFWGFGPEAAETAGHMKQPGRWWLLLPKPAAARVLPAD
ncbi:MAG TPA: MltA domain-containing protein [Candidatus Sulfotelmatobacter sp.]|nr:MltA domain-containing protein [Candidatus Sulfotelmatobacter sp.]